MKGLKHLERGFTLMELMVVIVIVAILAAVAVPLYINYVNDARDTEAKGAIGAVITAEQAYYQANGAYVATTLIANPKPGNTPPDQGGLSCDVTDALNNWAITTTISGATFVVTAAGTGNGQGIPKSHSVSYSFPPTAGTDPWTIK
jgi:prepilin-type N-terminal cleavage/methylation domain-containing protein